MSLVRRSMFAIRLFCTSTNTIVPLWMASMAPLLSTRPVRIRVKFPVNTGPKPRTTLDLLEILLVLAQLFGSGYNPVAIQSSDHPCARKFQVV